MHKIRRQLLLQQLPENSIAIIFAGRAKKSSADQEYPFEVNRNFFYLTGIQQENSILILVKTHKNLEFLLIDENDYDKEKWTGYKLTREQASETSQVENILMGNFEIENLLKVVDVDPSKIKTSFLDLEPDLKISNFFTTLTFRDFLEAKGLQVRDVSPFVVKMRMKKSSSEIEEIEKAIAVTNRALLHALEGLQPGKFEYNIRNAFEFAVKEENCELAFPSIVAGGRNGTILHYPTANDVLKDGDLVLLDVGARKNFYCADISRTYPVNGQFSALQKKIYEIVLECNKATIEYMRPGLTLKDVNDFAKNFLAKACVQHKLLEHEEDISKVYYHNVSHHLGLDTHDPCLRELPLEENNVITCEPGLYFAEFNIGVRIEDDILICSHGSKNLSKDIAKEVTNIENLLAKK